LKNSNWFIILAAILVTAAVFILVEAGSLGLTDYLGIAALIGGIIAFYFGYRFLMAYFGKTKMDVVPTLYAELRTYEYEVATGLITLYFSVPEKDKIRLVISDVAGNEAQVLIDQNLDAGSYPVEFDTKKLDNGTYFYELTTSNHRNSKKLIIRN